MTKILVQCWGAGGGAAVCDSQNAGTGGYCSSLITTSGGSTFSYAVGAGGTGNQPYGSTGDAGGNTTFGSLAAGGGSGCSASGTGSGGSASGGDVNVAGNSIRPYGAYIGITPCSTGAPTTTTKTPNSYGQGGCGNGNNSGSSGYAGQITITYVG